MAFWTVSEGFRARAKRAFGIWSLPGWIPIAAKLFSQLQGIDFVAKVAGAMSPNVVDFLRDWGWALGTIYIAFLVLYAKADPWEARRDLEMERLKHAAIEASRAYLALRKRWTTSVLQVDWDRDLKALLGAAEYSFREVMAQAVKTIPEQDRWRYHHLSMEILLSQVEDDVRKDAHHLEGFDDTPAHQLYKAMYPATPKPEPQKPSAIRTLVSKLRGRPPQDQSPPAPKS